MKLKKVMSVLLASAVMLGALTGCGGDKKEAAKSDVVKVGVFLPLTGDNAAGGPESCNCMLQDLKIRVIKWRELEEK